MRLRSPSKEDMQRQIELLTKPVGEKQSEEDGHGTGSGETYKVSEGDDIES